MTDKPKNIETVYNMAKKKLLLYFLVVLLSIYALLDLILLSPCLHGEYSIESIKEWQDGLRALLHNININFGGMPNSFSSSASSSSSFTINHTGVPGVYESMSNSLCWNGIASLTLTLPSSDIRVRSCLGTLHSSENMLMSFY